MSLQGRTVIVTGVSRPRGIGFGVARACARSGARVLLHGLSSYDAEQAYPDARDASAKALAQRLVNDGFDARALPDDDLADPSAPARLFEHVRREHGIADGLVLNHACSLSAPLGRWTAEHVDRHLHVNVRASMLLLQDFAAQLPEGRGGAVVLMTSGQYLGPMTDEIAYAVSKEAVRALCTQSAAALVARGIRVNCVNPGPTDTGYLQGEAWEAVRRMFPAGRWGTPEDAGRITAFLLSEDAAWITGQTLASEGGFRR